MKFFLILILLITNVFCQWDVDNVCIKDKPSENQCVSIETNSPDYQCCFVKSKSNSLCTLIDQEVFTSMTNPKLKKISKEELKYLTFLKKEEQYDRDIICKDEKITNLKTDYDPTDEDKTIFESENYCLNYYARPIEVTKEICENAQVLKETSEEGIKCGLYEIEKTERNGEKSNFKTCYFVYNSLILGGLSAKIIFNTVAIPYFVSKLVPSSGIYFNYTVNFSSFDSLSASYDSKTSTFTFIKSKTNKDTDLSEKKASSSYNLYNSKLLLLLLFLILL